MLNCCNPAKKRDVFGLIKFLLVGSFGAAFYILGSYLLMISGLQMWVASIAMYAILIPIVYLIQKKFVFESGRSHLESFPRYLFIQFIGLVFSITVPWLMSRLEIHPMISFLSVAFTVAITNYTFQKVWVFPKNLTFK